MANARAPVVTATTLLLILLSGASGAAPDRASPGAYTVAVEATGTVPGLTPEQLGVYLADRMHGEAGTLWEFTAGKGQLPAPPNRVVWSFKTERVTWKGGGHRGFPAPSRSVTYLSAEVKLYLNDAYQTTILVEPTVTGGPDDTALAEMVRYVAHALFVEKKPVSQ